MRRAILIALFLVVAFAAGWFLHAALFARQPVAVPEIVARPSALVPAGPPAKVFEEIYRKRTWGTRDGGVGTSGSGSTMGSTAVYRAFLVEFLKRENVKSVVDAGCGDWEFSQSIDWTGIEYKGYDIVEAVVAANKAKYEKPNVHFYVANVVETELPPADLLIVKHVLQHLPNADVAKILKQVPKYRHALLVNGVDAGTLSSANPDIRAGDYRELDPTKPPFSLPGTKVLSYFDGFYTHQVVHVVGRDASK